MKNILSGNEAIDAYEKLQGTLLDVNIPEQSGYFMSDDCDKTSFYDKNTVIAFDIISGVYYEDQFSNINEAIEWINITSF